MKDLLPFLYTAEGKFSLMALLAFVGLVIAILFGIRKIPPLRAIATA